MEPNTYSFSVTSPDRVDAQRILQENPDADWLLVSAARDDAALLFVRNDFLERFVASDGICVAGAHLWPGWGNSRLPRFIPERGGIRPSGFAGPDLEMHRYCKVRKNMLTPITKEIEAARTFRRKMVITVRSL